MLKYSLRGNQQYENMKLVFKHFSLNLNAKMAFSTPLLDLERATVWFELINHEHFCHNF